MQKIYTFHWNEIIYDLDNYEILSEKISELRKNGEIVLIGDFNARTGNLADLSLSPNDDVSLDQQTLSENF